MKARLQKLNFLKLDVGNEKEIKVHKHVVNLVLPLRAEAALVNLYKAVECRVTFKIVA